MKTFAPSTYPSMTTVVNIGDEPIGGLPPVVVNVCSSIGVTELPPPHAVSSPTVNIVINFFILVLYIKKTLTDKGFFRFYLF